MNIKQLDHFIVAKKNLPTPMHAARTAVAATVSLLVARLFRLPEDYWAAIACLMIMQSTLGAALPISAQRFTGSAIGCAAGALAATYFGGSALSFGISLFVVGILCWTFRIDRSAYRYAGITLAVVMLINYKEDPSIAALHRFAEVSLGIAVALALTTVWPERPS